MATKIPTKARNCFIFYIIPLFRLSILQSTPLLTTPLTWGYSRPCKAECSQRIILLNGGRATTLVAAFIISVVIKLYMLAIAQIYAILALLLAFNVDSSVVNNVRIILEKSSPQTAQSVSIPQFTQTPQLAPNTGGPDISVQTDCSPSLSAKVVKEDGDITTGIDFNFIGTAIYPFGCKIDLGVESSLQMQGFPNDITYRGRPSDWASDGQVQVKPNGFVFSQGWGTGTNIPPIGSFIWTVGATSTIVSISY